MSVTIATLVVMGAGMLGDVLKEHKAEVTYFLKSNKREIGNAINEAGKTIKHVAGHYEDEGWKKE